MSNPLPSILKQQQRGLFGSTITDNSSNNVVITKTDALPPMTEKEQQSAGCGPPPAPGDDDIEMEDMFVTPDLASLTDYGKEWGGPRRGGRFLEPTRFGDWERKCRCTDF